MAKEEVYAPFVKPPTPREFKNNYENPRYNEIIDKYSNFYNNWIFLDYYKKIILQAKRKLELSIYWKFDIIQELEGNLIEFNNKYEDFNEIIKSIEKLSFKNEEPYYKHFPLYTSNDSLNLLFNEPIRGYEKVDIVVLFEEFVFNISKDLSVIKIYDINELTAQISVKTIKKRKVLEFDYVSSIEWLHSRKDGGRDLRFKNNYMIYNVTDSYFYFDKILTPKLLIKDYEEAQKLKNTINRNKNSFKTSVNNNYIINSDNNNYEKLNSTYVFHSTFGYGEITKDSEDLMIINFLNNGEKKMSKKYTKLQYISEEDYINEKKILDKSKEKNINKKFESKPYHNIEKGDFINHETYGLSEIVDITPEFYNLRIIDGKIKTVRKHFIHKLIYRGSLYKKEKLLYSLDINDYVYNTYYGYGKVLLLNSEFITVLWKNKHNIINIERRYLSYLVKINQEEMMRLNLTVDINDIVLVETLFYKSKKNIGIVKKISGNKLEYLDVLSNKNILTDINNTYINTNEDTQKFLSDNYAIVEIDKYIQMITRNDYYTNDEYKEIIKKAFEKYNKTFDKSNKTQIIKKLSFQKISNANEIFLNPKFENLEEYIRYKIYTDDIYYYDYNMDSQSYKYILNKLCNEQIIIKTDSYAYITVKKMNDLKIYRSDILNLENKLMAYLEEHSFITINRIKDLIAENFKKVFVTNQTLVNFINSFKGLRNYKIGGQTTFVIKTVQLKSEYFESTMMELMNEEETKSLDIYDVVRRINDQYGFEFDVKSFARSANDFKYMYFSEETEKLYYKKKYYYEEVFK